MQTEMKMFSMTELGKESSKNGTDMNRESYKSMTGRLSP